MQIIEKRLEELRPYANNPRKNDEAVEKVAESIREFGFKVPIVIDKNGEIVAGHTRYKAAQALEMETIPCIVADDLTEQQIKAFRLADNKVAEFSEWEEINLLAELQDIDEIDMSLFGFDLTVFDDEEIAEDDYEENPEAEPRAKRGDLWQLGKHRLLCGDSINLDDVQKVMGGGWQTCFLRIRRMAYPTRTKTNFSIALTTQIGLSMLLRMTTSRRKICMISGSRRLQTHTCVVATE